jgi:hypothetical protein
MADTIPPFVQRSMNEREKRLARERQQYHGLMRSRPTPTQHEVDLIRSGANLPHKEGDGDEADKEPVSRSMEAQSGGGYATRQMRPESRAEIPKREEPVTPRAGPSADVTKPMAKKE